MKVFLFVLLSIMLVLLVSGAYTFAVACIRRKELPWFEEAELKKTSFGKYYPYIIMTDQWLKEHNAQDVFMMSEDGLKLHAYWVPAEDPKGTIILAHGYRSTLLVDFSRAFDSYHKKGLNILAPQQRAHGESEGKYITFGVKESEDFRLWIEYHNAHFGPHPLILSGMSMGASTVLYLADQNLPENVKGIIADCGFTSPKEIIAKVFQNIIHLPAWICMWSVDLFARIFAGFSLSQKNTKKALANSRLPVLLVHGKADDFVPCSMTEAGYAICTSPKTMFLVEGAGHGVSYIVAKDEYSKHIDRFLHEVMEDYF
jgi:fermentation-respiration switch protein FrsA (DUF1100 family)